MSSPIEIVLGGLVETDPAVLSGTDLSSLEDIKTLTKWFAANTPSVIYLDHCEISDTGAIELAEYFASNEEHAAQVLFLDSNNIGSEGAKAFAALIVAGISIQYYNFLSNNIKNKAAQQLCDAFIGSETVSSVCGVCAEMKPSSIDVQLGMFSPADAILLGGELVKGTSQLTSLALLGTPGVMPAKPLAYKHIFKALEFTEGLVSLTMGQIDVAGAGEEDLENLSHSLASNTSLKTLCMRIEPTPIAESVDQSNVDIEVDYSCRLLRCLDGNTSLTTLRLQGFHVMAGPVRFGTNTSTASTIKAILRSHPNLTHLSILDEDLYDSSGAGLCSNNLAAAMHLIQAGVAKSKTLRVIRIHDSGRSPTDVSTSSSRKKRKESVLEAFSMELHGAAVKRTVPLVLRCDNEEYILGEAAEDEQLLLADWEVGDVMEHNKVYTTKKGKEKTKTVPVKVLGIDAVAEEDGEIEGAIVYTLQTLDDACDIQRRIGASELDPPFGQGVSRGETIVPPIDATGTAAGTAAIDNIIGDVKERESKANPETHVPAVEESISPKDSSHKKKKKNKSKKTSVDVHPKYQVDDALAIRFRGDPEWYMAGLKEDDGSGVLRVQMLDETEANEEVEWFLARQPTTKDGDFQMPEPADSDRGYYEVGDAVGLSAAITGEGEQWSEGVVSKVHKDSTYSVQTAEGGVTKNIPGRYLCSWVVNGEQFAFATRSDHISEAPLDIAVVTKKRPDGSVRAEIVAENEEIITKKFNVRQIIKPGKEAAHEAALTEYASYCGTWLPTDSSNIDHTTVEKSIESGDEKKSKKKKKEATTISEADEKSALAATASATEGDKSHTHKKHKKHKKHKHSKANEEEFEEHVDNFDEGAYGDLGAGLYDVSSTEDESISKKSKAEKKAAKRAARESAADADSLGDNSAEAQAAYEEALAVAFAAAGEDETGSESEDGSHKKHSHKKHKKKSHKKSSKIDQSDDATSETEPSESDGYSEYKMESDEKSKKKHKKSKKEKAVEDAGAADVEDDESRSDRMKALFVIFRMGTKVEVDYRGKGTRYSARITRDRLNGIYDVEYDDGETEENVPMTRIFIRSGPRSQQPTMPSAPRPSSGGRNIHRNTTESTVNSFDYNNINVSNTVENLMEELTLLQQIHDEEAITIRKAMNIIDSKRVYTGHLSQLTGLDSGVAATQAMSGRFSPRKSTDGQTLYAAYSDHPAVSSEGTSDLSGIFPDIRGAIASPISRENGQRGLLQNNRMSSNSMSDFFNTTHSSQYPVPISRPKSGPAALYSSDPAPFLNSFGTNRSTSAPSTAWEPASSGSSERMAGSNVYDLISSLRALAGHKGWNTVATFVEEMATIQGGRSELIDTLTLNGYEGNDNLDALFLTLSECRNTTDPTGYLQTHLNAGQGLRSGHAQKIIARFNDLIAQNNVLQNLQNKIHA
jgi:hypothetical protein